MRDWTACMMRTAVALLVAGASLSMSIARADDTQLRVRIGDRVVLGEADLARLKFASQAEAIAAFEKNIVRLEPDQSVQLQVELVPARGKVSDVTKDSRIRYDSTSPWKLKVSSQGLVTAAPDEEYRSPLPPTPIGDTAVVIGFEPHQAWNKIFFSIEPRQPPAPHRSLQ